MEKRSLIPRTVIDIDGKLIYNESFQAWNTIRLKKEIFSEFPQLKEKRSKFSYNMKYFRTFEELLNAIKKMKNEDVMPILMFLYKEN